jgi:hypothetical protein
MLLLEHRYIALSMPKIFINYRRDDCIATAGRLHDRLAQAFGSRNIFMDVDHIPAGVDFKAHLDAQVAVCDVLLVLIGPHWLTATDERGERRLDHADDFVATEIAAALARDIRVIPVLVDGARMPRPAELSESLKPLSLRNAVEVRNTQFGSDVQRLVEKIGESKKPRIAVPLAAGLVMLALCAAGWAWWQRAEAPSHSEVRSATAALSVPSPKNLSRIRLRQAVVIRASENHWQWIEKDPRDNHEAIFDFVQISSSPTELVLYDASRPMYARFNYKDRKAYWREKDSDPWKWNYDIVALE